MPMKNKVLFFASACLLLTTLFVGCHPGRKAASRRAAEQAATITSKKKILDPQSIREKYAGIMGVKPKNIENVPLYSFIDTWYGTRYRMGGNDRNGIDCSAFARKLYDRVYRIDLVRTSVEQYDNCKHVKGKNVREGDLVFFRIDSKRVSHVGIYLMNDYFVHASTSKGVMISNLNEPYWQKYFEGIGRIPTKG
jgi:hypothetical protein